MAAAVQNGEAPIRPMDEYDEEFDEALLDDLKAQQFDDGMGDDLERISSLTMAQQADDIQGRLVAAAQPLDFSAPLQVKFESYDSYCNLFHFILNSDGPVDLEPPSVSPPGEEASSRL
jgi:translation initiation factor 3 subunit L